MSNNNNAITGLVCEEDASYSQWLENKKRMHVNTLSFPPPCECLFVNGSRMMWRRKERRPHSDCAETGTNEREMGQSVSIYPFLLLLLLLFCHPSLTHPHTSLPLTFFTLYFFHTVFPTHTCYLSTLSPCPPFLPISSIRPSSQQPYTNQPPHQQKLEETMMRSNSPSIPIPRTVPLLPLHDKVLLPGVVTRLQISRRDSIPLFEKILRSYDSKDLNKCIIGVFPVHTPAPLPSGKTNKHASSSASDNNDNNNDSDHGKGSRKKKSSSISKSDYGGYPLTDDGAVVGSNAGQVVPLIGGPGNGGGQLPPVNPAHIHATGCAARLVRLERAVGGFTVMLEGEFSLGFFLLFQRFCLCCCCSFRCRCASLRSKTIID